MPEEKRKNCKHNKVGRGISDYISEYDQQACNECMAFATHKTLNHKNQTQKGSQYGGYLFEKGQQKSSNAAAQR